MDAKGAQELALLLQRRHGVLPDEAPRAHVSDEKAAPIFRWLGIEPPASASAPGEPVTE